MRVIVLLEKCQIFFLLEQTDCKRKEDYCEIPIETRERQAQRQLLVQPLELHQGEASAQLRQNVFVSLGDDVFGAECARAEALHEANGTEPGRPINATEFWPQLQPPDDVEPTDAPDQASVTDSTGSGGSDTTFPSGGTIASSTTPSPAPPTTTSPPTTGPDALVVTCRDVVVEDDTIRGVDCLNGSLVPRGPGARQLPDAFNFTTFRAVYGWAREHRPADPHLRYAPPQPALTLYANSRLQINLEACVNTLQDECKRFLVTHGKDGRNDTAPSQFPCFFDKSNGFFVVARFDLEKTLRELVVAVAVPAALFVVSWVSLCVITRSVKVGDDARMRCQYCAGGAAADPEECGALAPAAGAGARARRAADAAGASRRGRERTMRTRGRRGLDPVERAAAAEAGRWRRRRGRRRRAAPTTARTACNGDDDEETELVMGCR
ncbi:Uncharacterized protein GBIM_18994 [Gryllus bimaculatus]|nr:Uncharacterized protein GBIM_18994 [Gryllus bimaculatus]